MSHESTHSVALVTLARVGSGLPMMLAQGIVELVGPNRAIEIFGVKLVGMTAATGRKILLSIAAVAVLALLAKLLQAGMRRTLTGERHVHARFWWRQTIRLVATAVGLLLLLSIWFDDPGRLTTAAGLITAGLAIALQRVVTAFAAYFVILRGGLFRVGDRIVMGGVRGDVVGLGFIRTTIMEMGQPPPVQGDDPAIWVEARQYSGRIVTITNDRIFDEPVYNYTRDFPYLWEELKVPVPYSADRERAEQALLEAARKHSVGPDALSDDALRELRRRYFVDSADLEPRVYWRLTDNWLELTVRFVTHDRGIREIKDAVSRDVLRALDAAGIPVASATFEVTDLPPLRLEERSRA